MGKYSCDDIAARLDEYLDGETDAETSAAIEEHIGSCERCRRELEEMQDMRRLIKESDVTPPPELHDRIMMSVHAEAKAARRRRFVRRFGTVAAAVVLVVGIAWVSVIFSFSFLFGAGSSAPEWNGSHDGMADGNKAEAENPYDRDEYNNMAPPGNSGGAGDDDGHHEHENSGSAGSPDAPGAPDAPGSPDASNTSPAYDLVFYEYGHGYDGGYVIYAVGADERQIEQIASWFDAKFDGTAFTIPYSADAMEKVTSLLGADGIGYSSMHVGGDGSEQCIIVSVK